jgi:2-polyprenyl-6-methoxyphenol hydroxylase-like FAD-dependent oxidoreductase
MSTTSDLDVVIVGAGPVGLFLANECARRGMRFRIIESHATQSTHSKALAIFPRTLEVLDMAGLAEPFIQAANRVTGVAFASNRRVLGRISFVPVGTPYAYVAMVPQDVTENLLLQQLRDRGGDVEYETTLASASQTDSHVTVSLEHGGQSTSIEAAFVVGCDGAHSTIRGTLGLQFEGGSYAEQYMLADVHTRDELPADEMQLCPNRNGPLAIFPISTKRKRLVATVDDRDGEAPSLDQVNAILAQRGPEGFVAESIVWSSYFKIHHRCVSCMGIGRMFIAGDAAHIHSPFGGQGMNTGLQDVWNLAWKLEFARRGVATGALLASYSQERYPIVKGVIETTHLLTTGLGSRNPIVQGIRDTMIPVVTHISRFQDLFVNRLSGLGISYAGSPIVEGDGKRYFDERLQRDARATRYSLLIPSGDMALTEAANALAKRFPDAVDVRSSLDSRLLLVRPDGYVACQDPQAGSRSVQAVEAVLSRQLKPC